VNIFLLELEFLPLLLVIGYVGAISILFLFTVIMLDVKFVVKEQKMIFYVFTSIFLSIIFFGGIFINAEETFFIDVFYKKHI
jgi:NADH-quinone oxidoreductase subunit J